jgi:HipA-like protein
MFNRAENAPWANKNEPSALCSISLPLDGSFSTASSHYFFANLLPEGSIREQICKSLKI